MEDKYPSFIPSATKTKRHEIAPQCRPLSKSETRTEISRYQGDSVFLQELYSLPVSMRATEALTKMKEGRTMFGSLGAAVAYTGLFLTSVSTLPLRVATAISPSAATYVDSTAAVLLERVENALPIVKSDPVKLARKLKHKSKRSVYDGGKYLVKTNVGQLSLKTMTFMVTVTESLVDYVAPTGPTARDMATSTHGQDDLATSGPTLGWSPSDKKNTENEVPPTQEVGLLRQILAFPFRTVLRIAKPVQKIMVHMSKDRRNRKCGRTPRRGERRSESARKSMEGRPKASPKKRATSSAPQDVCVPPFYRRLSDSFLVALRMKDPTPVDVLKVPPPNYEFNPDAVTDIEHKFEKRSHDDVESDDSGNEVSLSELYGDFDGYCSQDDPSFEWDESYDSNNEDSYEYLSDSFSDLEDEINFIEKEADSNILGGRLQTRRINPQLNQNAEVSLTRVPVISSQTDLTGPTAKTSFATLQMKTDAKTNIPPIIRIDKAKTIPESIETKTKSDAKTILPENTDAKTVLPENKDMKTKLPESKDMKTKLPENKDNKTKLPESKDTKTILPENKGANTTLPENNDMKTKLPENNEVDTTLPENKETKTKLPENKEVNTTLPENKDTKTKLPKNKDAKTKLLEDKAMNTKLPENKDVKTTLPANKDTKTKLPEDKAMNTKLPENKDVETLPENKDIPTKATPSGEISNNNNSKPVSKAKQVKGKDMFESPVHRSRKTKLNNTIPDLKAQSVEEMSY